MSENATKDTTVGSALVTAVQLIECQLKMRHRSNAAAAVEADELSRGKK